MEPLEVLDNQTVGCARLASKQTPEGRGKRKAAVEGRQRFKELQEDLEESLKTFARENPKNAEPLYLEELRRKAFGIPKTVVEYKSVSVKVTSKRGVVFTARINAATRAKVYRNRSGKRRAIGGLDPGQVVASLTKVCAESDSDSGDSDSDSDGRLDLACHELLSGYD